jgi:copper chaperone CopZ
MFEIDFRISGMTCPACVKLSTNRISKIEGIHLVEIEKNGKARICANREISLVEIQNSLSDTDYKVS